MSSQSLLEPSVRTAQVSTGAPVQTPPSDQEASKPTPRYLLLCIIYMYLHVYFNI